MHTELRTRYLATCYPTERRASNALVQFAARIASMSPLGSEAVSDSSFLNLVSHHYLYDGLPVTSFERVHSVGPDIMWQCISTSDPIEFREVVTVSDGSLPIPGILRKLEETRSLRRTAGVHWTLTVTVVNRAVVMSVSHDELEPFYIHVTLPTPSRLIVAPPTSQELAKLNKSIMSLRRALISHGSSHDRQLDIHFDLASTLLQRFVCNYQPADLEESVSVYKDALELQPTSHPDLSSSLYNLACGPSGSFDRSEDMEVTISLFRAALELRPGSHPDRSTTLHNLAWELFQRFDRSGQSEDMEESISLYREALELTPRSHSDRSTTLCNLAQGLSRRFDCNGQSEDMEESISLYREALELRPASHPHRSTTLHNLAWELSKRFDHNGQSEDMEESISLYQEALELRPASHPHRSTTLHNLALGLSWQFDHNGQSEDMEESISLYREALKLRPAFHPHRSTTLHNLAWELSKRFDCNDQSEGMEESILLYREALEL